MQHQIIAIGQHTQNMHVPQASSVTVFRKPDFSFNGGEGREEEEEAAADCFRTIMNLLSPNLALPSVSSSHNEYIRGRIDSTFCALSLPKLRVKELYNALNFYIFKYIYIYIKAKILEEEKESWL